MATTKTKRKTTAFSSWERSLFQHIPGDDVMIILDYIDKNWMDKKGRQNVKLKAISSPLMSQLYLPLEDKDPNGRARKLFDEASNIAVTRRIYLDCNKILDDI